MFWITCAALVAIVAIAIAAPLMRGRSDTDEPAAAFDLRVYRDQLREVERDLERGVITPTDAERLRVEIGRKVLAADRALEREATSRRAPGGLIAIAALLALLAGGVLLYTEIGAPQRPDEPIARRIADAQALYDRRPDQAMAEANAPKPQLAQPEPEYADLIEQLRKAVQANPDDPRGLELLAEHESRLGNTIAAKQAQARLVALRGDTASGGDWARLAALTVEAAGGLITAEGENAVAQALERDPRNPQARFMTGLLQIQSGRPDLAFPVWAQLLTDGPESAPWIAPIRTSIRDLAWFAGQPDYTPPETSGNTMPSPDADALTAAEEMTPEQRQEMIRGMVKGLENRLSNQGGTPQEWARLIGALPVIGEADHAQNILAEARTRFAGDAPALEIIETAAQQAGLK